MNFLLDTHILVWALGESHKLSPSAKKLLRNERHRFWFSPLSITEIAIKNALGAGKFVMALEEIEARCNDMGATELPFRTRHAIVLQSLPPIHRDPFDRMLIAHALGERMRFATADAALPPYGEMIEYVGV